MIHHLSANTVSLVLDTRGGGLPVVVHWGAPLGELSEEDLEALADATVPPAPVSTPDAPVPVALLPEAVRGYQGDVYGETASLVKQATGQNPDALSDAGCPGQCLGQRLTLNTYLALKYAANDICHCWGGAAETLEGNPIWPGAAV